MKTSDFHFDLPKELIASEPLACRSASRLMCLDKTGSIEHKNFYDLPELLKPGDLLVYNNSRVIPARLYAKKQTGGKIEILIERILSPHTALAHVKGAKNLAAGAQIYLVCDDLNDSSEGTHPLSSVSPQNDNIITIGPRADDLLSLTTSSDWHDILETYGHVPLPPYIERTERVDDRNRYQTVYADTQKKGSVAAPTAGLHFDESLLEILKNKGIKSAFVTLHVGAGTFQPVRVDNIRDHKMHAESYEITQETVDLITQTKKEGGRVIAVGTTTVRVLESAAQIGALRANKGETDIFITPGYEFKIINGLITNFHLPESTLLMLVSALRGKENIINAYHIAIQEKYRFFSYGDAMLLA